MNDLDLEARIRAAAPHVSQPLGLAEHSTRILEGARRRRQRSLRIWAAGAAASAVLAAGGTVAVAGNGLQTPWGWTADSVYQFPGPYGQTCYSGLRVEPDGVPDDAPEVAAAREFVAGLDLNTLDTSAARARAEAENDQPFGDGTPGVLHNSPELIEQFAMHGTVAALLFAEMENRGLRTPEGQGPVSLFSMTQGCQ
ncbi:hypothetical protein H9638_02210 [Arthrobacter sp. Sa2BUA2]|uniref:CAP domain-containing protein n=1 Tax=Arthrobacter pullicola TaxID=2762224 RepID=A0ABR8YEH4_9MICC|nr:hypothetical protein [Arthrobacter pullicola]MBD8042618.1 hypothetical protein [Arthrobacter pullicola]